MITSPKTFAQETQNAYQPVRVAIGDQNFQKYNYENLVIFGTSDVQVYDKANHNLISTIPIDTPIEISITSGIFQVATLKTEIVEDEEVIQKEIVITTNNGLVFDVVESIPVHENIKLGKDDADHLLDVYCETIRRCVEQSLF